MSTIMNMYTSTVAIPMSTSLKCVAKSQIRLPEILIDLLGWFFREGQSWS